MAKPKKLTVKIFENRRQVKPFGSEDSVFWPLYLNITFNRKTTSIKSPTFDFLERMNMGYDLITGDTEIIRLNDERLLNNYRLLIEGRGDVFSLDWIANQNETWISSKTTIYDLLKIFLSDDLFKFFHGKGPTSEYPATALCLGVENLFYFLGMVRELRADLFLEFKEQYPGTANIIQEFENCFRANIFPFYADFQAKEPFTANFRTLI